MAAEVANQNRQRLLLGLLGVVLVAAVWIQGDKLFGGSAKSAGVGSDVADLDERMKLLRALPGIQLERPVVGEDFAGRRDLFDFTLSPETLRVEKIRREEQKKAAEERVERLEQQAKLLEEQKKNPPPPPRPVEPPAPAFNYAYQAYIQKRAEPADEFVAILTKRGAKGLEPVPVAVGDTLDDTFIIKSIDEDTVVIGYTNPRFKNKTETVKIAQTKSAPGGGRRR